MGSSLDDEHILSALLQSDDELVGEDSDSEISDHVSEDDVQSDTEEAFIDEVHEVQPTSSGSEILDEQNVIEQPGSSLASNRILTLPQRTIRVARLRMRGIRRGGGWCIGVSDVVDSEASIQSLLCHERPRFFTHSTVLRAMHHNEQPTGNACNGSTREGGLVWRGCSASCDAEDGTTGAFDDGNSNPGDKLEGSDAAPDDPVHLKRRVGLFSGVALIVGTMIGSGIFVSPSGLLARTGSVGISFIIWMACGLLSLLGALAYAELGTMNTSSGAEYAYFMDAFGGPPAFLFSWVSTLVLKPSQMAIICLSFAKYAVEPFVAECEPPDSLVKLVAVISIVMILAVNCYSVNLATNVQNIFTAAKLVAIAIIVCGGAYKLILGNTRHLQEPNFASSKATLGNIATAFYTGLWAYDGWNNLNYVTEEIKNPSKNLPLSIIIGIPLVTLCYALVNVSYLAVMSVSEMADSEAVAVTFGNRLLGPMAWLMPLAVTISTFGSANGTLFVAGRLCFAASREGHLLDILSYVHVRRFTPAPGLIFHSLIAVAMVLYGTIDSLIDFFSFTAWIFYGGAMLALIVMRYTKPHAPRPYKVPIIIPYIVLFVSAYLVVAPILDKPQWEYMYAAAFILGGLLVYLPFVKWGYSLPFMDKITVFLQMVLEVVPTSTTFEY